MKKDKTSGRQHAVSGVPSARRQIFISFLLIGITLCASCSKEVAETEGKGAQPDQVAKGGDTKASLQDLIQVRNSGALPETDHLIIAGALESGSDAEKSIAISIILKHLDQGCFAVDPLIRALEAKPESSARIQAIRALGKLGPCAKSAQDVLQSIAAGSNLTESTIARLSLKQIGAVN